VNREAGTIENVLICGTQSANGRDYPPAVFRRDYKAYEGRPCNCDHGKDATVERRLGWFSHVRCDEQGRPRGTLNVLKSHPMYERVMESAERFPGMFGFSHVAECQTTRKNGREVVEAINRVESIDLVAEPATTKGLFEGLGSMRISTICETVRNNKRAPRRLRIAAARLREAVGDHPASVDLPDDASVGSDASADQMSDAVTSGMKAAFDAIRDQLFAGKLDRKAAKKKLDAILDAHETVNSTSADNSTDATTDTDTAESRFQESVLGRPSAKGLDGFLRRVCR
jgi:hypothetical protein